MDFLIKGFFTGNSFHLIIYTDIVQTLKKVCPAVLALSKPPRHLDFKGGVESNPVTCTGHRLKFPFNSEGRVVRKRASIEGVKDFQLDTIYAATQKLLTVSF